MALSEVRLGGRIVGKFNLRCLLQACAPTVHTLEVTLLDLSPQGLALLRDIDAWPKLRRCILARTNCDSDDRHKPPPDDSVPEFGASRSLDTRVETVIRQLDPVHQQHASTSCGDSPEVEGGPECTSAAPLPAAPLVRMRSSAIGEGMGNTMQGEGVAGQTAVASTGADPAPCCAAPDDSGSQENTDANGSAGDEQERDSAGQADGSGSIGAAEQGASRAHHAGAGGEDGGDGSDDDEDDRRPRADAQTDEEGDSNAEDDDDDDDDDMSEGGGSSIGGGRRSGGGGSGSGRHNGGGGSGNGSGSGTSPGHSHDHAPPGTGNQSNDAAGSNPHAGKKARFARGRSGPEGGQHCTSGATLFAL